MFQGFCILPISYHFFGKAVKEKHEIGHYFCPELLMKIQICYKCKYTVSSNSVKETVLEYRNSLRCAIDNYLW